MNFLNDKSTIQSVIDILNESQAFIHALALVKNKPITINRLYVDADEISINFEFDSETKKKTKVRYLLKREIRNPELMSVRSSNSHKTVSVDSTSFQFGIFLNQLK